MRSLTAIIVAFSVGCGSADGSPADLAGPTVPAADASTSDTAQGGGLTSDAMTSADGFVEATGSCRADTDCNDGDDCTLDLCERGEGEFTVGLCGHAPQACDDDVPSPDAGTTMTRDGGKIPRLDSGTTTWPDSGTTTPPGGTTLPPAVDTTCAPGCAAANKTFPAAVPLTSTVPATCTAGFEINQPVSGTTYTIKRVRGTGTVPLEVQFATYLVPDHIKLVGITETGEYPVVDTCTVQTANYGDPTGGCTRPPVDSIRQYAVTLRADTTALRADFTGVCSPIYLRVRGLCDFDITPFTTDCKFRSVP